MFRPDFLRTNEEWCIWLLADEFNNHATPQQIIERTRLTPGQVEEIIRDLERMKAIRVVTIPGMFPPDNIKAIGLQKSGTAMYQELLKLKK